MRPLKSPSGPGVPWRSSSTFVLCIQGRAKCTYFRRSGRSTIKGQRSTNPFRKASSELVPVSTHSSLMPARLAASFTVSTPRPEKPPAVRSWTGGLFSKPMRSGRDVMGCTRGVKYQSATRPAIPAAPMSALVRPHPTENREKSICRNARAFATSHQIIHDSCVTKRPAFRAGYGENGARAFTIMRWMAASTLGRQ